MSETISIEAFVLFSTLFKDFDHILTLFSKELGLIKLIVKGANRPKSGKLALCQPLTHANYLFKKNRGDLHLCLEGKLINPHLALRDSYDHLTSALELLQLLLKTQAELDPAPALFALLKSSLSQLSSFKSPQALVSSFYLKLLLHEGYLCLKQKCSHCHKNSDTLYFYQKDYYCRDCTSDRQLSFTREELQTLLNLVKERSFQKLKNEIISENLHHKIKSLYAQLYEVMI